VQKLAAGRVDASALSEGHDGREHRQALGVGTGHVDTRARKLERGLHEALPLESPVALPELSEAGRHSGHRAGGDAHLVVDDLVPERDADVLERRDGAVGMTTGDRDEEVEETRLAARCVVPDRVPSAGKPCHDRFGHAGGERGCDSRVRGGPALLENAQTRFGSGRMACCNPWRQKHVC